MREINKFESEERLVDALRHLAQESPRNAPLELGTALASAFYRHHRRRRVKNAAIAALVIICLSSAAWLFTRTSQKPAPQIVKHNPAPAFPVEKTMTANVRSTQETKKAVKHVSGHGIPHHSDAQIEARQDGDFLPLPAPGAAGGMVFLQSGGAEPNGKVFTSSYNYVYTTNMGEREAVKAAPYSATAVTESTQVLADGNRIVNKSSTFLARDGEGRTRREMHKGLGPLPVDMPRMVMITEPVSKTDYMLSPKQQTGDVRERVEGAWVHGSPTRKP